MTVMWIGLLLWLFHCGGATSFAGSTGLRWSRTYRIGDAGTVTVDVSDLRLFELDPTTRERLFSAFDQLAVFDAAP